MNKQRWILITILLVAATFAGCIGGNASPTATTTPAEAAEASPTPTPLALAPTLAEDVGGAEPTNTPAPTSQEAEGSPTPVSEGEATATRQGPTPLPEPTQIEAATATPSGDDDTNNEGNDGGDQQPAASSGPGITMNPQLGEPGDTVLITGTGFEANETVTLHWGAVNGETGPVYHEVETTENGRFEVGLIVLPADRWPGGAPVERDLLQLRAKAESLGENYYFANFTYIPRSGTITSLALTYTNEEYGYQIRVPNEWTWTWQEDDLTDVRFESPAGRGQGFVRIEGASQEQAITTVMSQEFPGQDYSTGTISVGSYPGTEATTANGRVVQFITVNNRTYALSFINDDGAFATNIHQTFTLQ